MGRKICCNGIPHCKLYLQPEWDKASIVTPLIIEYIKANPKWELCLQMHKYINVPKSMKCYNCLLITVFMMINIYQISL